MYLCTSIRWDIVLFVAIVENFVFLQHGGDFDRPALYSISAIVILYIMCELTLYKVGILQIYPHMTEKTSLFYSFEYSHPMPRGIFSCTVSTLCDIDSLCILSMFNGIVKSIGSTVSVHLQLHYVQCRKFSMLLFCSTSKGRHRQQTLATESYLMSIVRLHCETFDLSLW